MSEVKGPIPYWKGDKDNHELAVLFWPGKIGCITWAGSAVAITIAGSMLMGVGKEDFNVVEKWPYLLGVLAVGLLSGPIASYSIVWHQDSDHYDRENPHVHGMDWAKAFWNGPAWVINSIHNKVVHKNRDSK